MTVTLGVGKAFEKIQHLLMIKRKTLKNQAIDRNSLNLMGNIYKNAAASIILYLLVKGGIFFP